MVVPPGCSSSGHRAADHAPRTSPETHPQGVREDCSTSSGADFPGAFSNPSNLVVGPLVLIGGAYTSAGTVRQFGGNKFPLIVKAGHAVTVRVSRRARRTAGLAYGPLPQRRETTVRDSHRTVTFVACAPGRPSENKADGVPITFWSGGVVARRPVCVPLEVYVDAEPAPRRVGLPLGRSCPQ